MVKKFGRCRLSRRGGKGGGGPCLTRLFSNTPVPLKSSPTSSVIPGFRDLWRDNRQCALGHDSFPGASVTHDSNAGSITTPWTRRADVFSSKAAATPISMSRALSSFRDRSSSSRADQFHFPASVSDALSDWAIIFRLFFRSSAER